MESWFQQHHKTDKDKALFFEEKCRLQEEENTTLREQLAALEQAGDAMVNSGCLEGHSSATAWRQARGAKP